MARLPNSPIVRNRRGFTLGEVLVTIALISVMAAVVIPAVTSQITKGDLGRVTTDLLADQNAIQQFVADVRRYPKSLGQLIVLPTTSHFPLTPPATAYATQELARWRGPYLNKDSAAAGLTGYSLRIGSSSPAFKFDTLVVGTTGVFTPTTPGAGDITYLVIPIANMNVATAQALDAAMDDGVLTTGLIRWKALGDANNNAGASPVDTLKFLAIVINK
jgi:prepilin-type N-terminal cleavage/methylation domain-containing protein